MRYISKNEKETRKIAADFAGQLHGGEIILMYGDLGAGKTVFVKGLAKALGVKEIVKSPTFNIMKCYGIKKAKKQKSKKAKENPPHPPFAKGGKGATLCHIDAYRLKNFDDLLDIGAEEFLGKENVITVIEWAERINIKTLKHPTSLALRIPLRQRLRRDAVKLRGDTVKLRGAGKNIKTKAIKVKIEHGKKDNERIIKINELS